MNYTENLNLPQWEGSDRIDHEDFNEAMEKIDEAITATGNAIPNIVTGTYSPTDVYGSSNPSSLSFDFVPKLLVIWDNDGNVARGFNGKNMVSASLSLGQGRTLTTTWGTTVTWYSPSNATYQMNNGDKSYYYLAIG